MSITTASRSRSTSIDVLPRFRINGKSTEVGLTQITRLDSSEHRDRDNKINSELGPEEYDLCRKLINGMKTRKIYRLKELHIQKQQILDLQSTVQDWLKNPENYRDLISKSLKDLRRKKIKLMNTHYKYYMSTDWSWLLHTKARETNPKKQFKPVYEESKKMTNLMTTDDEESEVTASFYR